MNRFIVTVTAINGGMVDIVIPEANMDKTAESIADEINAAVGADCKSLKIGTSVIYIPNVVSISVRNDTR